MGSEPISDNKPNIINNAELVMLHEFNLILNSTHNIDAILQDSARKIREVMQSDGCHILFTRYLRNKLKLETAIFDGGKPMPDNVDETKGISGLAFETGQMIIVTDAERDSRVTTAMQQYFGQKSMASVPITVKGSVVGVIVVYSSIPARYSERDGQFLMMLGSHLGLAVENANLMLELKKAAITDPLTGAYNYGYFRHELESVVDEKRGKPVSLIMIDINNFKSINDAFGHLAGDYLLKEVTSVLKNNVRAADTVARYGGDEFAVILPGASGQEALLIAERIELAVAGINFTFNQREFKATVSWGAITTIDRQVKSINRIIELADKKLYNMKKLKKSFDKNSDTPL
ncbi:MAG TPA: sensor domain-containing diguanylate cyclase [Desulfobacteria bacterium]|nr:sensor domain-containing diguanylate cyclase [Desulfobacteria bacterium]